MADVIATLGLAVDANGAIVNLKQFETATKATGSAATKAADDVVAASARITTATRAEAAAIRAKLDTANEARASAQVEKASTVAGAEAFLAQERARKAVTVTTVAQTAAAQATTTAAAAEIITAKGLIAAWTAEAAAETAATGATAAHTAVITATTTATVAATGATTLLSGALAAVGGPIGAAVLAAMVGLQAVLSIVQDRHAKAAEKAKEQAKAIDEATEAAIRYRKEQTQAFGADTIAAIEDKTRKIAELTAQIDAANRATRFTQSGAVGSGTGVVAGGGPSKETTADSTRLIAEREALQAQLNALNLKREQDAEASKIRERNILLKGDQAIATDRAAAIEKLKFDNERMAKLRADAVLGVDNQAERAALTEEIKAIEDGLSTKKADAAARKEMTAAEKLFKEQLDRTVERLKEARANHDALNKYFNDGVKVAREAAVAQKDLTMARDRNSDADARAAKEAKDLEARTKEVTAAMRALYALGPNANLGNLANANVSIGALNRGTESWADTLQSIVGIAQLIASAFGDVGREIAKAATGAQSIISGLSAAQKIKDSAGNGVSFGTALGGAAGLGAQASALGAIGQVVGGVVAVADALDLFGNKAREQARKLRDHAAAFNAALSEFAIVQRTSLDEALRGNFANATGVAKAAGFEGVQINSLGDIDAVIKSLTDYGEKSKQIGRAVAPFIAELERLRDQTIANEIALRARNAAEEASAVQDVGVRLLRAQGLTAEAEALAQTIANERELADARAKYGEGALTLAIQVVQTAEAIARAAKKLEEERRSIFDLNNATQAFTDPRGARQAAFDEAAMRRYADAVEKGASANELAAIAAYNLAAAADFAAQQLEADLRTTEGFMARILGTLGDDRATQNFVRESSQRQEIADAIRDGMSPTNMAILEFTHFVEDSYVQMQRAIEDGTKAIQERAKNEIAAIQLLIDVTRDTSARAIAAIDAQIKETQTLAKATSKAFDAQIAAIREQTKAQTDAIDAQIAGARDALEAANRQVSALEKSVQTNQAVVDALTDFSNSQKLGDLSSLSPEAKLLEARAQFEAQAARAAAGDATAAQNLPNAANALLQQSRGFFGSNAGFVADERRIQDVIGAITQQFGATLPTDIATLEAARAQVSALESSIDMLGKQKDAIEQAAQDQIAVLQAAKDQAAENAQKIIDGLNDQKDKISADANATIEKLEADRKSVQDWADAEVERLKVVEQAAHNQRVAQTGFLGTIVNLLQGDTLLSFDPPGSGPTGPSGNGPETFPSDGGTSPSVPSPSEPPATNTTAQQQLTAQRETIRVLTEKLDAVTEKLDRLLSVSVVASRDEVQATENVGAAVNALTQETRMGNQGNRARGR